MAKTKTKKKQTVVEIVTHHTDAPCVMECGTTVAAARRVIGYDHCMDIKCIAEWRRRRLDDAGLVLVFVHKQGLQWIRREDVPKNDMKRQGGL